MGERKLNYYRVFRFDKEGRIHRAGVIKAECREKAEAIRKVRYERRQGETWCFLEKIKEPDKWDIR